MEYKPPAKTDTLVLPGGRTLAWCEYGDVSSTTSADEVSTIFYFHGIPGSRLEASLIPLTVLKSLNARCIAIDRPGMGMSTYYDRRAISDWPADVLAVADHVGIKQFYIIGISGGAPYALACARAIPRTGQGMGDSGRLLGTATASGFYPLGLGITGMLTGPRILLTLTSWLPTFMIGRLLDWEFGNAARSEDPKLLENIFDKEMSGRPEVERRCIQSEHVRRGAIEALRESFKQGGYGAATDLGLCCGKDYHINDMDGAGITMWHGTEDQNTPFAMAEKAAIAMPRAVFKALEGEGHMSTPINYAEQILKDLVKR